MFHDNDYPESCLRQLYRRCLAACACAALAAVCSLSPAAALTIQPGTYRMEWRIPPSAASVSLAGRMSASLRTMTSDDRKKFEGAASKNAVIGMAGAAYWVVVDESKGSGKGYDSAYVISKAAAGGKVSLKSAGRIRLARSGSLLRTQNVQDVTITLALGGRDSGVTRKAAVDLEVYTRSGKPYMALLTLRGGWHGSVKTDAGELEIQPMDVDSDNIYGERFFVKGSTGLASPGDAILMGSGSSVSDNHGNVMYLGSVSSYAGKLYIVSVSKSGDSVTFAPYKGDMGKLKIYARTGLGRTAECRYAQVYSSAGMFVVKGGQTASVPPGDYRCLSGLVLAKQSSSGKQFSLTVRSKTAVRVSKNTTTTMKLGGWLNAVIEPAVEAIRIKRGEQRRIHIYFTAGGDEVLSVSSGRKVWVNIRDSREKLLSSEQAAFGPGAGCWYNLRIPADWKTGTYRIGISFDPNPYQGEVYARKTLQVQL